MTSICVDGFNLALAKGSGIATYGRNLLENLKHMGAETQVLYGPARWQNENDLIGEALLVDAGRPPRKMTRLQKVERSRKIWMSRFGRSAFPVLPSGEVIWPSQGGGRPAADRFWAAQELFSLANRGFTANGKFTPVRFEERQGAAAPDVMHWSAHLPLYAKGLPNIVTFHDLIPLRLPHTTLDDKRRYLALSREAAARADHIIVVSETTRQDVIRLLGIDETRVTNTYQAVNLPEALTTRTQADIEQELAGIFNLDWKSYFLHFGAIEPKKNLGRIVEAYLGAGLRTPLVIIGGRAWLDEGETALLAQVKRDAGPNAHLIRQYDYMSFSMLISLIRGAKATIFPSLYEGFGLPVLESMALSTAVLASTGGALPEISGDAALLVDPYDVQAIRNGLRGLDADEGLRRDLEARGRVRATAFSAEAYRNRLQTAYSAVGVNDLTQ